MHNATTDSKSMILLLQAVSVQVSASVFGCAVALAIVKSVHLSHSRVMLTQLNVSKYTSHHSIKGCVCFLRPNFTILNLGVYPK